MTVYRNRQYALLIAVVATLFALASIASAIFREGDLSAGARWGPVLPVLALSAFCLLRLARAGVYADDAGIRVLNPLKTERIPWEHLQRFTLRAHRGFAAVAFAERLDGTRVLIWGIQARSGSAPARRVPEEVVAALNERLAQERERR